MSVDDDCLSSGEGDMKIGRRVEEEVSTPPRSHGTLKRPSALQIYNLANQQSLRAAFPVAALVWGNEE
jgi:hypothetical protein